MPHRLGDFELRILFALVHLGADAYGVTIRDEIEARTGRAASAGALYTALSRLEARGFVASRLGEPTAERGGKARRCVRVTRAGLESLRESRQLIDRMWKGLDPNLRSSR